MISLSSCGSWKTDARDSVFEKHSSFGRITEGADSAESRRYCRAKISLRLCPRFHVAAKERKSVAPPRRPCDAAAACGFRDSRHSPEAKANSSASRQTKAAAGVIVRGGSIRGRFPRARRARTVFVVRRVVAVYAVCTHGRRFSFSLFGVDDYDDGSDDVACRRVIVTTTRPRTMRSMRSPTWY